MIVDLGNGWRSTRGSRGARRTDGGARVNVARRIDRDGLPMKLLLKIGWFHDEGVLETPAECAGEHARGVCEEMEAAMSLKIPLVIEAGIGQDWMSAKYFALSKLQS